MVTGPIFNVPAFIEMVAVVVVMGWPLYIHSMVGMGKPDAEQGSSSSFPSRTGLSRCGFFVNFGGTRTVTIACRILSCSGQLDYQLLIAVVSYSCSQQLSIVYCCL